MKYVKKPVVIDAVVWNGVNSDEVELFTDGKARVSVIRESDPDNHIPVQTECIIPTLEGDMEARIGDYIIKGVNGEYYPCKPDIFEKTYKKADLINFGEAIELLKQGKSIRRRGWNGKGLVVFKQVPSHIGSDIIPKMQSLPQSAKDIIIEGTGFIDYTNQCLIYDKNVGRADSWVPSISDIFAEDWEIVR